MREPEHGRFRDNNNPEFLPPKDAIQLIGEYKKLHKGTHNASIDHDGYPTEATLIKIEAFNMSQDDPIRFTEYICEKWVNGFPPEWNPETGCLYLGTGGWSGCESIIASLKKTVFWTMFWYKSKRGGHYWFVVKRIKFDRGGE